MADGATYTVATTVTGLSGTGLVLQLNGRSNLAVQADGSATFSMKLATGASYGVTVTTQPTSPSQICSVGSGSGTVGAEDVTSPTVTCVTSNFTVAATVTGLTGPGLVLVLNQTQDITFAADGSAVFPNALASGTTYSVAVNTLTEPLGEACAVANGGGTVGSANITNVAVTCAVPIYSTPAKGDWTFMTAPVLSTTPVQGTASVTYAPGGGAASWTDTAGNLWTFGGSVSGGGGYLNALWKYVPTAGTWTWVNGSLTSGTGVYGTLGTAAATNLPPGRTSASAWTDTAGNLWLFGGTLGGPDTEFNDLWKYNIASGLWTWVGGSQSQGAPGVYGTLGTPAAGNVPPARASAVTWADAHGNFWLFGGTINLLTNGSFLNDLWEYNPTSGFWTWQGGPQSGTVGHGATGVYGTLGTGAAGNVPGGRYGETAWAGADGNLWLFGGSGFGTSTGAIGILNDLWKYNPTTGLWTWVGGPDVVSTPGFASAPVYGTKGTPSAGNIPGARFESFSWLDSAGNFWLFGGEGFAATGPQGDLNDLWEYNPAAGTWTWVSGTSTSGDIGSTGTPGVSSSSNLPAAQSAGISWTDAAGNFWLMGAQGLWVYTPATP